MDIKGQKLFVASFAAEDHLLVITKKFQELGLNFELINTDTATTKYPVFGVLIILLDRHSDQSQSVVAKFLRNTFQPTYVIVFDSLQTWSDQTLNFCNEFSPWPCDDSELVLRLSRLVMTGSPGEAHRLNEDLMDEFLGLNLLGNSDIFLKTLDIIKKLAGCDANILIQGETGTGKELAARAIHYLSAQSDNPFIPVNCGAIPDNLFESELFGHTKGAFTDAKTSHNGIIAQASGGTLFFDEVDALSPKGQVTLLRFLQDQEYRPLGGENCIQANVRILAACNAHLSDLVEQGLFRRDLYYRLNILSLDLPPLRERGDDVILLAQYFIDNYSHHYAVPVKRLSAQSMLWLKKYDWPGNIRELEHKLHREFLLADGNVIILKSATVHRVERRHQIHDRRQPDIVETSFTDAKKKFITEFETKYLCSLLKTTHGNISKAAELAGKERRAFGKMLQKHGIDKTRFFNQ